MDDELSSTPSSNLGGRLGDLFPAAGSQRERRVAESLCRDACDVWATLWDQFKPFITRSGLILPEMEKGFVPACGWPEFLEQMWLLKHYLDALGCRCAEPS